MKNSSYKIPLVDLVAQYQSIKKEMDKAIAGVLYRVAQQIHQGGMDGLPVQAQNRFWLDGNFESKMLAINFAANGFRSIIDAFGKIDGFHDTK